MIALKFKTAMKSYSTRDANAQTDALKQTRIQEDLVCELETCVATPALF